MDRLHNWQRELAELIDRHPELRRRIERHITDDFHDAGDNPLVLGKAIGYRNAWLEIFNWYKREVTDVNVARFAAGGSPD